MLQKLKIALLIVILVEEIRSARKLNSNDMNRIINSVRQQLIP
ncbi:hypothetical protein ACUXA0_000038 [Staphylococcus hominis]